jgi:hypothetical protein
MTWRVVGAERPQAAGDLPSLANDPRRGEGASDDVVRRLHPPSSCAAPRQTEDQRVIEVAASD